MVTTQQQHAERHTEVLHWVLFTTSSATTKIQLLLGLLQQVGLSETIVSAGIKVDPVYIFLVANSHLIIKVVWVLWPILHRFERRNTT